MSTRTGLVRSARGARSFFRGLALALACAGPLAAPPQQQALPELRVFRAPAADPATAARDRAGSELRLRRWASGEYGAAGDYRATARIGVKTAQRAYAETQALRIGEFAAAPGWSATDGVALWRRPDDRRESSFDAQLVPAEGNAAAVDADELWIDYTLLPGAAPCAAQVDAVLRRGDGSLVHAASGAWFEPRELVRIDVPATDWREKGLAYVAARELGIGFDDVWRYTAYQGRTLLQRRLDAPIGGARTLELQLAPGSRIEHVNLRVARGNARGEVLEFPGIVDAAPLPSGTGVRIAIGEALEQRFPRGYPGAAGSPPRLQEISIFFSGDPPVVLAAAPLRRVSVLAPRADASVAGAASVEPLPTRILAGRGERQRLVADLRALAQGAASRPERLLLRLAPPASGPVCALRVQDARFAKLRTAELPLFATELEARARDWMNVVGPPADADRLEAADIVAYLPFASLALADAPAHEAEQALKAEAAATKPAPPRVPPFLVRDAAGRDVAEGASVAASDTASLACEGPPPRMTEAGGLATWEGRARRLELSWLLDAPVTPQARVLVTILDGADKLGTLALEAELADGRIVRRTIVANEPQSLVDAAARIRRIRLAIEPTTLPFRVKLRDIVLFEPHPATPREALEIAMPAASALALKPQGSPGPFALAFEDGHVAGLASASHPFRFTTAAALPVAAARSLHVAYRLSPRLAAAEACAIGLRLNGVRRSVVRQLCLRRPAGEDTIALADLLGRDDAGAIGALQSIEWTIAPASDATPESFDLALRLDAWVMTSASASLTALPVAFAGPEPIFTGREAAQALASARLPGPLTLPLDVDPLWRMGAAGEALRAAPNEWFTLDEVAVTPPPAIDAERWSALLATAAPASALSPPARWLLPALLIAAVLLAWSAWRVRARIPGWRLATRATGLGGRVLWRGATAAGGWASRWPRTVHGAIALVALVPGAWIAGKLGTDAGALFVMAAVVITLLGAHAHWRAARGRSVPAWWAAPRVPALLVAGACVVWSVARFGAQPPAAWSLLPLVATLYAWPPRLSPAMAMRFDYRRYLPLAAWLAAVVALYVLGVRMPAAGENLFLTFAAVAAVLAWRAFAHGQEGRIRRVMPGVAARMYDSAGGIYFCGALVALAMTLLLLAAGRREAAEHVASVIYFCMLVALAKEAWAHRGGRERGAGGDARTSGP